MPKRGFKVVTVRQSVYDRIEDIKFELSMSMPEGRRLSMSNVIGLLALLERCNANVKKKSRS